MKKLFVLTVAVAVAIGLAGCEPGPGGGFRKQDVGVVAGGVAGGILGSAVFHGRSRPAGAIGGAILGGLLGSTVGKSMDDQDRMNLLNATSTIPVGSEATWTSHSTGNVYTVRPVSAYHWHKRPCRMSETMINMGGRLQRAQVKACRYTRPNGTHYWRIV